jgi:hypothetical protein
MRGIDWRITENFPHIVRAKKVTTITQKMQIFHDTVHWGKIAFLAYINFLWNQN